MSATSRICLRCQSRLARDILARHPQHATLRFQQTRHMTITRRGVWPPPPRGELRGKREASSAGASVEGPEGGVDAEAVKERTSLDPALTRYRALYKETASAVHIRETVEFEQRSPVTTTYTDALPRRPLPPGLIDVARKFKYPPATHRVQDLDPSQDGQNVVVYGFISSVRKMSKNLIFFNLYDFHSGPERTIQVVSYLDENAPSILQESHQIITSLPLLTPVAITATAKLGKPPKPDDPARLELLLESLTELNTVRKDEIYTPETRFPPWKRYLQLRTSSSLSSALRLRAKTATICRRELEKAGFIEVETPLLFKSTPEGAREFLVPTRQPAKKGPLCYALPQSPQQYKQMLMASGIPRYYQVAKCFRDEDLRADRQPEFTQLDLEMSFARGKDVMEVIERLLKTLWEEIMGVHVEFKRMTYLNAMLTYGTDKPDLRFPHFDIRKIRDKDNVKLEGFALRPDDGTDLADIEKLVTSFKATLGGPGEGDEATMVYIANEKTAFGVPEYNLAASDIDEINETLEANPSDVVVLQKRSGPISGGNTRLGLLRTALINKALSAQIITPANDARPFEFVWITDFPLFSPSTADEPGQYGTAGLSSTHHPFTAPHEDDLDQLTTAPQMMRAEHYDIVVNGVELGGGSRRIHDAALQRYILEDVLKVPSVRIRQFEHLLGMLESGCPPHAGIALGFDRLVAMLHGTDNVRNVIAFPKTAKGFDLTVQSPSHVSVEELATYHIQHLTESQDTKPIQKDEEIVQGIPRVRRVNTKMWYEDDTSPRLRRV